MPEIDSSNLFQVRRANNGRVEIVGARLMTSEERALNLAAWIRCLVDPDGQRFEDLVRRIKEE
jgi:hypothetical protein